MRGERPRLWHLPSSHFSEKVRWALEHKGIAHTRRVPLVVPHVAVAAALTRREVTTFPVVQFPDGVVGDSTAIIAALESRFPDPPLYPHDEADRVTALELEEWFDEQLGADVRLLALHEVSRDPPALQQLSARHIPAHFKPFPGAWSRLFGAFIRRRYGLDAPGAADAARAGVARAFDHLEEALGDGEYLVGDTFTVADLAAAAHFYWLIQPPEGPRIVDRLPPPLAAFMSRFEDRDGYRWVLEVYRRHRRAHGGADAPRAPAVVAGA